MTFSRKKQVFLIFVDHLTSPTMKSDENQWRKNIELRWNKGKNSNLKVFEWKVHRHESKSPNYEKENNRWFSHFSSFSYRIKLMIRQTIETIDSQWNFLSAESNSTFINANVPDCSQEHFECVKFDETNWHRVVIHFWSTFDAQRNDRWFSWRKSM